MFKARYRTITFAEDMEPGIVVVLLGTALKGPVMEPVAIAGPEHALRLFGEEGTLLQGYRLASAVNPNAAYFMMRINGEHARLVISLPGGDELLTLKAIDAGSAGNLVRVAVEGDFITITSEDVVNRYSVHSLVSVGELVDSINDDANRGYSPVEAGTATIAAPLSALAEALAESASLEGGDDGYPLTKNELYGLLEQAYKRLEGYRTDIVVPLGVYLNDDAASYTYGSLRAVYGGATYSAGDVLDLEAEYGRANFAAPLMDFCARQMGYGLMSHGIIGMRPMPDSTILRPWIRRYIHDLAAASCLKDRVGFAIGDIDRSHHVSAVLGDLMFQGDYISAAPAYAALLAGTGIETTTGRGFSGFEGQRTELDGDSMRIAAAYGLVTLRTSLSERRLVVYSGVTLAEAGRPLHYIANVRTAQYVIYRLRRVLDPFIGVVTGTIVIRDTLERAADNLLRELQKEGVIDGYSLSASLELMDLQALRCRFELSFRPKYSVEDISITVRYSL